MKSVKYLLVLLLIGVFPSCTTLTESPQGVETSVNYFKTSQDAVSGVTAVYYLLNAGGSLVQTPYNTLFSTGMDMMTDDIDPGPGATNPDVRSQAQLGHNSSGLRVLQIWQQHYSGIFKANVAIDNIPNISMSTSLQSRLIGEAKALRALYYFNLVRLYGGVPLVLHASLTLDVSALQVPRNTVAQVYTQIIQDLTDASAVLPNSYSGSDIGRITKGAAQSLLSKVYLTQ